MSTYQLSPTGQFKKLTDIPSIQQGDHIQLQNGFNHPGFSLSGKKGIKISTYGDGDAPVLGSFITIPKWVKLGNGLYSYKNSALNSKLNVLTIDGNDQAKGRFPKTGYNLIADNSTSDGYMITLPKDMQKAEGELVVRLNAYVTNTYTVKSHLGTRINFAIGPDSQYVPKIGYGYFLQNQIGFLTEFGDWMYDAASRTITMYFGDKNPNDFKVEVPTQYHTITIDNCQDIDLSDFNIRGSNGSGIHVTNSTGIKGVNLQVDKSGDMGVKFSGFKNSYCTMDTVSVSDANAGGIYSGYLNIGMKALNCTVKNIGMIEGASDYMNGDGKSNGLAFEGEYSHIEGCEVENVGLNGYVFQGSRTKVIGNWATGFGARKQDCAAFYSGGGKDVRVMKERMTVSGNVATGSLSTILGTIDVRPTAHAFYFDDQANGVDFHNNLGYNINGNGLYIHNGYDITVTDNTFLGNRCQVNVVRDNKLRMDGIAITDNTLVNTDENQDLIFAVGQEVGSIRYAANKYYHPNDEKSPFSIQDRMDENSYYTFKVSPKKWAEMTGDSNAIVNYYQPHIITKSTTLIENSTGVIVNKSQEAKSDTYVPVGKVKKGQSLMIAGELDGNFDSRSFLLESTFLKNGAASAEVKPYKANESLFAFVMTSLVDREYEQLMILNEQGKSSMVLKWLKVSEVVLEKEPLNVHLEVNQQKRTWDFWIGDKPVVIPEPEPIPEPVESGEFTMELPIAPVGYKYVVRFMLEKLA